MANSFFEPGAQRSAKVHALFNQIANRYDLINDLQSFALHRRWKHRLIALANLKPGAAVLDVCCGTADLALAMAAENATVAGLDFSEAMLQVAQKRAREEPAAAGPKSCTPNPNFIRGDAQRIPFCNDAFEVVTIGYGLRNLSHWETGLSEMFRVCKPGGRLLVLDFGKPHNPVWRIIYYAYLRVIVPILGRAFAGSWNAYAYILESLKHYPAQQGVAQQMRLLGMDQVKVINLIGGAMSINYGEKPVGKPA